MTYRAHQTLENHHKNGYNTDHFYHFQITITGSMSESITLYKIVHFHDFHIKYGADILARQMVFRGPAPDACIKQFLKFAHWFYV